MISSSLFLRSKRVFLVLLGAVTIVSCASASPRAIYLSMTSLIVDPSQYVGQVVATSGFFSRDANLYLFLTDDHAMMGDIESAILVSDTDEGDLYQSDCIGKYVELTGTLVAHSPSLYAIVGVQKILDLEARTVCWEVES